MSRPAPTLDRLAIGVSMFCLVHCLAAPLLVVLLPVMAGTLLADESFHLVLLFAVLPTSLAALWTGCRRHRDRSVLILGALGLVVLGVAAFRGRELVGETGEKLLTVCGSLLIVAGHWRNFTLCRKSVCAR
jgi:peptidoglycan/LPS O-acetylase OafA/YrhL